MNRYKKNIKKYFLGALFLFLGCFLMGAFLFFFYNKLSLFTYKSSSASQRSLLYNIVLVVYSMAYYVFGVSLFLFMLNIAYGLQALFNKKINYLSCIGLNLCAVSLALLFSFHDKQLAGLLGVRLNQLFSFFADPFLVALWGYVLLVVACILLTQLNIVVVYNIVRRLCIYAQPIKKIVIMACVIIIEHMRLFKQWIYSLIDGSILKDSSGADIDYAYEGFENDNFWSTYFEREAEQKKEPAPAEPLTVSAEMPVIGQDQKITVQSTYALPSFDIFTAVKDVKDDKKFVDQLHEQAKVLEGKLLKFGIIGKVTSIEYGPVVTLFEYQPQADSKLSKIVALEDDLAMALEAHSIRIIAPIPGKSVVGFEIANKNPRSVYFSSLIHSDEYKNFKGGLPLILGEDAIGKKIIVDLAKMPHLLVAGSTGSGKSVALNTMLVSLLCHYNPDELKLILIDPKRLEFSSYQDVAHLLFPIVTQPKNAVDVLKWLVKTMEDRYEYMATLNVKNIFEFYATGGNDAKKEMPFIVLVIDELADLMMTTGKEVEVLIARIAQMARAAGIHMIVATQRPSVDVITGLIKVNFPSRISFRVTSKIDSRTILDCMGAEKLLGRGDMLFLDSGASNLMRVHGAYISGKEINAVVDHIKRERNVEYIELAHLQTIIADGSNDSDVIYDDIVKYVKTVEEVSISLLQRKFRIGYNRSARIIEQLESHGYIMPADGGKMRKVVKQLH